MLAVSGITYGVLPIRSKNVRDGLKDEGDIRGGR